MAGEEKPLIPYKELSGVKRFARNFANAWHNHKKSLIILSVVFGAILGALALSLLVFAPYIGLPLTIGVGGASLAIAAPTCVVTMGISSFFLFRFIFTIVEAVKQHKVMREAANGSDTNEEGAGLLVDEEASSEEETDDLGSDVGESPRHNRRRSNEFAPPRGRGGDGEQDRVDLGPERDRDEIIEERQGHRRTASGTSLLK